MQASRLPDAIVSSTEATGDDANALAAPPAGRVLRRRRCAASEALLETAAAGSGRTSVAINCSDGKSGGGSRSPVAKRLRASETRSGGDTLVRGRRRQEDRVQPDEWRRREKSSNGAVGRSDTSQQSPRASTAPTIVITPAKERTRQVFAAAATAAIARTTAATPLSHADGDLLKPPTVSLDDGNLAVILRRSAAVAAGATAIGCLQPEQL